jgi:hypothetical protein
VEAAMPHPDRPVEHRIRKSPESVSLVLGCLMAGRGVLLPSHELPELPLKELYQQAGCAVVLGTADDPLVDAVIDPSAPPAGAVAVAVAVASTVPRPRPARTTPGSC